MIQQRLTTMAVIARNQKLALREARDKVTAAEAVAEDLETRLTRLAQDCDRCDAKGGDCIQALRDRLRAPVE